MFIENKIAFLTDSFMAQLAKDEEEIKATHLVRQSNEPPPLNKYNFIHYFLFYIDSQLGAVSVVQLGPWLIPVLHLPRGQPLHGCLLSKEEWQDGPAISIQAAS
jgi:hypothetical protein